jgi:hypothetical protein
MSSVLDPDPDLIRSLDPDSGSGSRRVKLKMTYKNIFKKFRFHASTSFIEAYGRVNCNF